MYDTTYTAKLTAAQNRHLDILRQHPAHGRDYKILRPVVPIVSAPPEQLPNGGRWVALLDCETSGLCPISNKMIEIAFVLLALDVDDNVVGIYGPVTGLEDPQEPLPASISSLTGLCDDDLAGMAFDDRAIVGALMRASVIIAHNCAFDASFVEARFPQLAGMPWADSCSELNWPAFGFDGRSLCFLLAQAGSFSSAHRAEADVASLYTVLMQQHCSEGPTFLQRLLVASGRSTVRIEATNAPFRLKDVLKARGYRWDADRKVWWESVELVDVSAEQNWLARQGVIRPTVHVQTASERHRPPRDVIQVVQKDDETVDDDIEPF